MNPIKPWDDGPEADRPVVPAERAPVPATPATAVRFPDWNGDPDCPKCGGRGVVSVLYRGLPGGATQVCDCRYLYDVKANTERIWKGLFAARPIPSTPLMLLDRVNLIITASQIDFRRHLRHLAIRRGPKWDARVVSDAALMTAWLASKVEVFDPDVMSERERVVSEDYITIMDIAVPFELLVIQLGVKAAKNREMPGVLLEALQERGHRNLPTWIVESPANPLVQGHICWDSRVADLLEHWPRITLSHSDPAAENSFDPNIPGVQEVQLPGTRVIEKLAVPAAPQPAPQRRPQPARDQDEEAPSQEPADWRAGMTMSKDDRKRKGGGKRG